VLVNDKEGIPALESTPLPPTSSTLVTWGEERTGGCGCVCTRVCARVRAGGNALPYPLPSLDPACPPFPIRCAWQGTVRVQRSGCTAVVCLVTPSHIICANAGDSRSGCNTCKELRCPTYSCPIHPRVPWEARGMRGLKASCEMQRMSRSSPNNYVLCVCVLFLLPGASCPGLAGWCPCRKITSRIT
jgi:hypothetical protein